MKTLVQFLQITKVSNNHVDLLTEDEMQIVRGGTEPTRPVSRPREVFDEENN